MNLQLAYVSDDGGRSLAGYKGSAGDCVTRALAILTCPVDGDRGAHYKACYRLLADAQADYGKPRSARNGIDNKVIAKVFPTRGLVKVKLPVGVRPTLAEAHARYGDCIISTTRHLACLKDGALHDTFDHRIYQWEEYISPGVHRQVMRERKAASVWVVKV